MGEPMSAPPLLYLGPADVEAAMPGVAERLELARRTMTALVHDAELPPKVGVHPGDNFTAAMPALLRSGGVPKLLGMKWVVAFAGNGSRGLPAIHATVIVNDAQTGVPLAILDGGPITAQRTAAVSGVALWEWGPPDTRRVALIGAGVQGHSHLEVLAHVCHGTDLVVAARHADRAAALA